MPAQEKSSNWISRLHHAHGAQLQHFLERMLGRRDVAEEVAQETYLKLYRLCREEEVECPRALLFDAAAKLAISRLRQARAEVLQRVSPEGSARLEEVPDDLARPDRRIEAEQALRWLEQIVEQLPSNLQKVFVMRYVRHMPRADIAEALQISINAVEQRLTRALAHCRVRLTALGLRWPAID